MKLHRHKWTYLAKEYDKREIKKEYRTAYIAMGSSSESTIMNVTIVRFFCKGCSEFKTHIVEGKVTTGELSKAGIYGGNDE